MIGLDLSIRQADVANGCISKRSDLLVMGSSLSDIQHRHEPEDERENMTMMETLLGNKLEAIQFRLEQKGSQVTAHLPLVAVVERVQRMSITITHAAAGEVSRVVDDTFGKGFLEGIKSLVNAGLRKLLENASPGEKEDSGFCVVYSNNSLLRVDYYMYKYDLTSTGVVKEMSNGFLYFAQIGVLDLEKVNPQVLLYELTKSVGTDNFAGMTKQLWIADRFHQSLYGRQYEVREDYGALTWLLNFEKTAGQLAMLLESQGMCEFNTIERRSERKNQNADTPGARPRVDPKHFGKEEQGETKSPEGVQAPEPTGTDGIPEPEPGGVHFAMAIARPTPTEPPRQKGAWGSAWTNEELRDAQMADPDISVIIRWKESSETRPEWPGVPPTGCAVRAYLRRWDRLELLNGVLYRLWESDKGNASRWQLVVPRSLRGHVIREAHGVKTAGHLGASRTLGKVKQWFYWHRCSQDVKDWCRKECDACAARRQLQNGQECGRGREVDIARHPREGIDVVQGAAKEDTLMEEDRHGKRADHQYTYNCGDSVWLLNRQRKRGPSRKLQSDDKGPYLIVQRIDDLTYRIHRGLEARTKVVHYNKLRPYLGDRAKDWSTLKNDGQRVGRRKRSRSVTEAANNPKKQNPRDVYYSGRR